jgi:hypothetical protein
MKSAAALFTVVLCACASGAGRAPSRPARMLKPEELPPRQREVLEAWRRGGAAWEVERDRVAADPELSRFLIDNLVVEMVRSFDRSALGSAVKPSSPFDRAQAELVRFSIQSTPVLVELLSVKDGIVAFLAKDTLVRIGTAAVEPASRRLDAAEPEVRRRAAELLEALPGIGSGETALLERLGRSVERDEAWIVRAQAARALGARAARQAHKGYAAAVLTRALGDADPEVQKSALDALVALGEISAVPALIRRLELAAREGDLRGLEAAQSALRRLTGEKRNLEPKVWWDRWQARGAPPATNPR